MQLNNSIGSKIKSIRDEKGLSQGQLVEKLIDKDINMSRETLSKIENDNRTISAVELGAICSILDINVDKFFEENNEDDLTTLFRKKGNFSIETIEEIGELQEMIKIFINQEKIFRNEFKPIMRKPLWEEF